MHTDNQTAIVTGGTKGIGQAIARKLWDAGYHVLVASRHADASLDQARLKHLTADVRYYQDHKKCVDSALNWTERLDVYVNCAGFSRWSSIQKVDEAFIDDMLDTNLKGTFWGCKAASEHMQAGASIINISSLAGKRGSKNNSVYCASKFAVNGMTQALAKELGEKGIRVNAVCPVYVQTAGVMEALMEAEAPPMQSDLTRYFSDFARQNAALGRLPLDREVANVCYFLASDAASAITGQCINVDCGVLPQ